MTDTAAHERARESFAKQAWEDAHAQLEMADREGSLGAEDLERLATAAQMLGHDIAAAGVWARAHTKFLERGDTTRAALCAYHLLVPMLFRGEMAQAGGWLARMQRLLEQVHPEHPAHGYLLCALAVQSIRQNDFTGVHARFAEAGQIGERFGDADLIAQARNGEGRVLIRLGESARGAALLDEVMAAVTAGLVSPLFVGPIYCSVIEACAETYDYRRAQEWTDAMAAWCARQPESFPFRGQCLVHRAEIMQLQGAWTTASEEAERARERMLRPPPHRSIGVAYYRIGELQRLRGDLAAAESAFRQASRTGTDTQPGLALLRLAQGQITAARTGIAHAMEQAGAARRRSRLIPAFVEIAIAAGDLAGARAAAEELAGLAAAGGAPMLCAASAYATGAVLLAERDARGALGVLREAFALWRGLEAPYESARARVLIARACRELHDPDTAAMELECARETFTELGAAGELAALDAMGVTAGARREAAAGGAGSELTAREIEVLRLVATGKTNRAIAQTLGISEKTIARHVSNIFSKLGLSSRAAATAYAYERGILQRTT